MERTTDSLTSFVRSCRIIIITCLCTITFFLHLHAWQRDEEFICIRVFPACIQGDTDREGYGDDEVFQWEFAGLTGTGARPAALANAAAMAAAATACVVTELFWVIPPES